MSDRAMDGWEVIARADELSRQGEEFALATVVWRQGPSSGQQGSRAIVNAKGEIYGWIGGACAEPAVIREAQRVIRERESKLLLLGSPDQFGGAIPQGMLVIPISCQSEGALEVYLEPVIPVTHLVIVGRSPMAHTLADLGGALGWRCELHDGPAFTESAVGPRSIVVIATQGHGDEEAIETAVNAGPAFVGLVASRRRGDTVLGYLADRGVPRDRLDKVTVPVGLDLGHTSHREIAVAILAQLVQLRAQGLLYSDATETSKSEATAAPESTDAIDPVCGMTVPADPSHRPLSYAGTTYWFCSAGCHDTFDKNPEAYVTGASAR